jgi:hypothetical protein
MKKSQVVILVAVLAVVALVSGIFIGKSLPSNNDVETENSSVVDVKYYGFDGVEHNSPIKGLNIVRTIKANGETEVKKVMIK